MNVVPFKPREPLIYVCSCGCASYFVFDNHTLECCLCGNKPEGAFLKDTIERDAASYPDRDCTGVSVVVHHGDINAARRSVLKKVIDRQDEIELLVGIDSDGAVHSWAKAGTKSEADGLAKLLRQLADKIEARAGYEPE